MIIHRERKRDGFVDTKSGIIGYNSGKKLSTGKGDSRG